MKPDEPTDYELRDWVASAVEPDEAILWVGRPSPRAFRGEVSHQVRRGILFVHLALALAILFAVLVRRDGLQAIVLLLPMAAFAFHAVRRLRAPGRYRDRLGRCVYAVTDRRALTLDGFDYAPTRFILLDLPGAGSRSFGPEAIAGRRLRRRLDGSADATFEVIRAGTGRRDVVERGFFGVEDAEGLEAALARVAPEGSAAIPRGNPA